MCRECECELTFQLKINRKSKAMVAHSNLRTGDWAMSERLLLHMLTHKQKAREEAQAQAAKQARPQINAESVLFQGASDSCAT